jgi:hypothetical protein
MATQLNCTIEIFDGPGFTGGVQVYHNGSVLNGCLQAEAFGSLEVFPN